MKEEWKLFIGWLLLVLLLLASDCTGAPSPSKQNTYELIEPLGTLHRYKKEPLVGKSYYCLIHEAPEIIYVIEDTKRVRRWSGHDWR
jgi:hypothetical protein